MMTPYVADQTRRADSMNAQVEVVCNSDDSHTKKLSDN